MTTALSIIQYDLDSDAYKLRIGDKVTDLPKALTDQIGTMIGSVEPFNTEHAHLAHCAWDGTLECDPDVYQVDT